MIDQTLKFLADELNAYLSIKTESGNIGKIFLKPLIKQDGTLDMEDDSVSLIMVNIQEEHAMKNQQRFFKRNEGRVELINPAINLNLLILFVANFSNYDEALKFLSLIIRFFQHKHHFNGEAYPGFDIEGVEEVMVRLQPLTLEQQSHLWSSIGAKYMPSVMFKVSVLSIEEAGHSAEIPLIESVESTFEKLS